MSLRTYLGLDLTSSACRPSGYAVLDEHARLRALGLVAADEEIVSLACRWRPRIVALDAPLSWPLDPDGKGRQCEVQLARQGIGSFRTTRRTIIRGLIERGIALSAALRANGFGVVEIYPYGSKVRLFGRGMPRKTTSEGRVWLRRRLARLVPNLAGDGPPPSHDELDAVVAAYTAVLRDLGLTEEVGDPAEGVICMPRPANVGALAPLANPRRPCYHEGRSGRSAVW